MNPVTPHQLLQFMTAVGEYVAIAGVILGDGDPELSKKEGLAITATARPSCPLEPTYPELRKYFSAITNDIARRLAAKGN